MASRNESSGVPDSNPTAKEAQDRTSKEASQASSPQLGERSADVQPDDRGGLEATEGRTGSEGGLGSAERSANQERSRGGQMGPGERDR